MAKMNLDITPDLKEATEVASNATLEELTSIINRKATYWKYICQGVDDNYEASQELQRYIQACAATAARNKEQHCAYYGVSEDEVKILGVHNACTIFESDFGSVDVQAVSTVQGRTHTIHLAIHSSVVERIIRA
jgi:hypothetical protein